jgi:hypothetical protein
MGPGKDFTLEYHAINASLGQVGGEARASRPTPDDANVKRWRYTGHPDSFAVPGMAESKAPCDVSRHRR